MDYIFIIGPSAVGKTTLAKELYKYYDGVYFEQSMVPEFIIPKDVEDIEIYEEQLCWENVLLQLKFFYDKGHRNIVALELDIAGKTREEVLQEAIRIIDNFEPMTEYDYELPDEKEFLSWVQSRQLF